MNNSNRKIFHILLIAAGIILMVGGIVTKKHGATILGLIIAAININLLLALKKQEKHENNQQ